MPGRLIASIFLAATLFAQEQEEEPDKDDGKKAYIDLHLDSNGHGTLTVSFEAVSGLAQYLTPSVLVALTRPLSCEDTRLRGQNIRAYCPGLLTLHGANLSGTIRVDALFQPLYDLGVDDVIAFVHIPDAAKNPATPEDAHWVQVLSEGKGLRYGHRSGPRHDLPPALQIEYPARHLAESGTQELRNAIAALCGIIFGPALIAAWLAHRATRTLGADSEAAIGEESLWVDLLVQFVGLFWIGLLQTLDLRDLALAQFPGQPIVGALFALALIVAPPFLGSLNCLAVWFPVLERTGLTAGIGFGEMLFSRSAGQLILLLPSAMLNVAITMLREDRFWGIFALVATAVLTLALSLARRSIFVGAKTVTGGELLERAQSLAQRAGTRLRTLLLLGEQVAPNAYAMPGKQIAISPTFLRQLSKGQVDAILAHELGHIRHNDFKIPFLVYTVYIGVLAPYLHGWMADLSIAGWTLLPQSLVLMMLMGLLSRHAEYRADRTAAELSTPEDTVRALCRIHRQSRQPMALAALSEVLLSHPSLINRARAVARDQQQSSEWLERILRDEWENRPAPKDSYLAAEPGEPALVYAD